MSTGEWGACEACAWALDRHGVCTNARCETRSTASPDPNPDPLPQTAVPRNSGPPEPPRFNRIERRGNAVGRGIKRLPLRQPLPVPVGPKPDYGIPADHPKVLEAERIERAQRVREEQERREVAQRRRAKTRKRRHEQRQARKRTR